MSLSGMDVAGVRQLAGQLSEGGELLDVVQASVRSGLYSLLWEGADAAVFRDSWERSHGPAMSSVAAALREASQHLLRQAADQLDASGDSAGGVGGAALLGGVGAAVGAAVAGGAGSRGGPVAFPGRDLLEKGKIVADGVDAGLKRVKEYGESVRPHYRGDTWVEGYERWKTGHADDLNRWFTADNARKLDRFGKWLGPVGVGFDTGLGGYDQWHEDANQGYSDGERGARAVGGGVAVGAVGLGVGYIGGVAGGVIGGAAGTLVLPVVGTASGAVVGAAAGSMVASAAFQWADDKWQLNDQVSDAGAWAASAAWDAGSAAVDVGGDVLASGADLLGDVGSEVADLVDDWSPW